jgi:ISXO2-like transposase domain
VKAGSRLLTDGLHAYRTMAGTFDHTWVDHAAGIYVSGDVHTQTIEGFWSTLKNGVRGTYHADQVAGLVSERVSTATTRAATLTTRSSDCSDGRRNRPEIPRGVKTESMSDGLSHRPLLRSSLRLDRFVKVVGHPDYDGSKVFLLRHAGSLL